MHLGDLSYALLFVGAVGFAFYRAYHTLLNEGFSAQKCTQILLANVTLAWLGARAVGDLGAHGTFPTTPNDWAQGPIAFLGAGIGVIAGSAISSGIYKFSWLKVMGHISPSLAIAHALGRLGCWIRGCCYGKFCPWPAALGTYRIPTQLIEALGLVLIAGALNRFKATRRWPLYMVLYALLRFALEFLRADPERGMWAWGLSTSQWLAFPLLVAGIGLDFIGRKLDNRGT